MNYERFFENFNKFSHIGYDEGIGVNRVAFTDNYFEAIETIKSYAEEKGFETKVDNIGNLFITYNPSNSDKFFMVGSHMDTVKNGGFYDGALGAISALEVIETLKDNNIDMKYGVIVTMFNSEEGSDLGGTFGSRTLTGGHDYSQTDFEKKLSRVNITVDDLKKSEFDFSNIIGFLEMHVEQGRVLEEKNLDIGILEGMSGIYRYKINIEGEANHAGTTPMGYRKDPVRKLHEILKKLYELADEYPDPFVMTVGDININPGAFNIIPAEIEVLTEARDLDTNKTRKFYDDVIEYINSLEGVSISRTIEKPSAIMNERFMEAIENSCKELGYSYQVMSTGAGHDAQEISVKTNVSMIIIPSVGGLSHSIKEYSTDEMLKKGIDVLYKTVESIVKE